MLSLAERGFDIGGGTLVEVEVSLGVMCSKIERLKVVVRVGSEVMVRLIRTSIGVIIKVIVEGDTIMEGISPVACLCVCARAKGG